MFQTAAPGATCRNFSVPDYPAYIPSTQRQNFLERECIGQLELACRVGMDLDPAMGATGARNRGWLRRINLFHRRAKPESRRAFG